MRTPFPLRCLALFPLVLPAAAQAQQPVEVPSVAPAASGVALARLGVAPEDLMRYEPTGLSLLRPYARGKTPVVLIHGLWAHPWSWHRMVERLEDDPGLRERYQFWTFGYSTGDPIPYSAYLMRRNLDEVRRRLDPDGSDRALDQMVVVGHSMGGLLAKMLAVDSGDHLWQVITDRPFDELQGDPPDRDLFRAGLIFNHRPEVRRVVFIATPHQGSTIDRGSIRLVGTRLVRVPDPLCAAHHRLVARNPPAFFRDFFRKGLPTSIDELEWGSPILAGLHNIPIAPAISSHSIIAVLPSSPPDIQSDGLVRFESARLAGVATEKIVATGHLCQDHPEVIAEVRRILSDGAGP
jgi:pimeloyl-ACP methyl ester carboxylesterase